MSDHVKLPVNGCSCDKCCEVRARSRRLWRGLPGNATDRERHVTERAQAIARAYQSAAINRGLQTPEIDEMATVVRDLIDVGILSDEEKQALAEYVEWYRQRDALSREGKP